MGYYERADLPLHYALADAFTLCDGYHCSVLGPSDPNHLMSISGTIDPNGTGGGPIVSTLSPPQREETFGKLTLDDDARAAPGEGGQLEGLLARQRHASRRPGVHLLQELLLEPASSPTRAFTPSYPGSFMTDVALGTLPQVSWI